MEFYKLRKDEEDFMQLAGDLSCGIILVMVLVGDNIVEIWKNIVDYPSLKDIENELAKTYFDLQK